MSNFLSSYNSSRDNNFNLIRFIAASLVLYSHSFALALGSGKFEPLGPTLGITWGYIAVDIFFVTSGFLITGSYLARNNIFAFVWARILRIYPALIVAVVFCILVGAYFTVLDASEYFLNPLTIKYFFKNIFLFLGVEHRLPGVFLDVPFKGAVNGSLWTLPYEVRMYFLLACVMLFSGYLCKKKCFFSLKKIMLILALLSVTLNILNHFYPILPIKLVRLFSLFFTGAAFFVWSNNIQLVSKMFWCALTLLLLSAFNKDVFFIVYSLTLPYLIFYLAYVPSGKIRQFNSLGDYSYGIYIFAFPVQQSICALIPNVSVFIMIILSFAVTFIMSIFSWHLIEKKFLLKKEDYVLFEKWAYRFLPMRK